MTTQRKRIHSAVNETAVVEVALPIGQIEFTDAPSVNVHGINITMGITPFGPDETFLGRWYVCMLPHSIYHDIDIRNAWFQNLNTIGSANDALVSSDFVWGAGSILCSDKSVFNHTFSPSTSRNVKNGGALVVVYVADQISGVIDNWDAVTTISCFTS